MPLPNIENNNTTPKVIDLAKIYELIKYKRFTINGKYLKVDEDSIEVEIWSSATLTDYSNVVFSQQKPLVLELKNIEHEYVNIGSGFMIYVSIKKYSDGEYYLFFQKHSKNKLNKDVVKMLTSDSQKLIHYQKMVDSYMKKAQDYLELIKELKGKKWSL